VTADRETPAPTELRHAADVSAAALLLDRWLALSEQHTARDALRELVVTSPATQADAVTLGELADAHHRAEQTQAAADDASELRLIVHLEDTETGEHVVISLSAQQPTSAPSVVAASSERNLYAWHVTAQLERETEAQQRYRRRVHMGQQHIAEHVEAATAELVAEIEAELREPEL